MEITNRKFYRNAATNSKEKLGKKKKSEKQFQSVNSTNQFK